MSRGRRQNRTHSKKGYSNDGLRDALSGIGGDRDILATGMMGFANYVSNNIPMLSSMYRSNIWVKKAVSIPAQYSVKGWRKLDDELFEEAEKKLNLKAVVGEALQWSLLFGGSLAFMVVDDGLSPDQPLNLNKVNENSFKKIIIVDKSKVSQSGEVNQDPLSDNFNEPAYYLLTIGQKQIKAHPSRCHKFIVNKLPYDQSVASQYWGVSQIEIIYRQLINDDVFLSAMANMMKRSTVDIFGIPGLSQIIANGGEDKIKERVRVMHSTMSTLNAFVKDAGYNGHNTETYERITQQFSGFDAMDIQSLKRLAAAAEIQSTIFLGESPDGMNATGNSDLSIFGDRLSTIREIDIDPFLYKVDDIIAACHNVEKSSYTWINPFPKSEREEADIRAINTQSIINLSSLDIPSKVLAYRMAKYDLIDNEEVDEVIAALEMEQYDLESESSLNDNITLNNNQGQ